MNSERIAQEKQYMSRVGAAIAQVLQGEGVSGRIVSPVRGPMTITYTFIPGVNDQVSRASVAINRVLGSGDTLQSLLGISPVRIVSTQGRIQIEIPALSVKTPSASYLRRHSKGANIAVGVDSFNQIRRVSFKRQNVFAVFGPPHKGKTQAASSILSAIVDTDNNPAYAVFCIDPTDWQPFVGKRGFMGVYDKPERIDVLLAGLSELGTSNIKQPLVIIVDDVLRQINRNKSIADYLAMLTSAGRHANIKVIFITQSSGTKRGSGGDDVVASATARLVFRPNSKREAANSTGSDAKALELLSNNEGDAILIVGSQEARVATGYMDDRPFGKTLPGRGVDQSSDWYDVFYSIVDKHQAGQVQAEEAVVAKEATLDGVPENVGNRVLTQFEVGRIIDALESGFSKKALIERLWGSKNGRTSARLNQLLEEAGY